MTCYTQRHLDRQVWDFARGAQKQVETFIQFLSQRAPAKPVRAAKRRFKFDWAGGLADLKRRFTAVELKHHLNELSS
jgi:hypothetical protein